VLQVRRSEGAQRRSSGLESGKAQRAKKKLFRRCAPSCKAFRPRSGAAVKRKAGSFASHARSGRSKGPQVRRTLPPPPPPLTRLRT
jgi:hypothetical protein